MIALTLGSAGGRLMGQIAESQTAPWVQAMAESDLGPKVGEQEGNWFVVCWWWGEELAGDTLGRSAVEREVSTRDS